MTRRAQLLRRIIAKHPWSEAKVKSILQLFEEQGIIGVCGGPLQEEPPVCPPPSYRGRMKWTTQARYMAGPVGLFCTSLAEHRAAFTTDLAIHSWPAFCFHLLHCPFQQVKAH